MIIGENIYLRPVLKTDLLVLNKWKNDEDTYKYLGGGFMPVSSDQQEKWIETLIDTTGSNKRYIICENNGNPIGMIGLYNINWIHRTCEIGVYIGDTNYHGKGYGKKSSLLMENFAKQYLNLRKIKLSVVRDNNTANNMWISLGYKEVGVYKEERFIKGEYRDLVLMEKFLI